MKSLGGMTLPDHHASTLRQDKNPPPPPPPYVMSGVLQYFPKGETTAKEAVSTSLGLSIEYRHQTKSAYLLVLIRATDNHSVLGYLQKQRGQCSGIVSWTQFSHWRFLSFPGMYQREGGIAKQLSIGTMLSIYRSTGI